MTAIVVVAIVPVVAIVLVVAVLAAIVVTVMAGAAELHIRRTLAVVGVVTVSVPQRPAHFFCVLRLNW